MAASSHARGGMLRGERRRLRRQPSLTVRPVELTQLRCIRGCRGREWVPLPCIDVHGRECVHLTVGAPWLQHCLGERRRGPWRVAVRNLMVECINAFGSCRASGHGDAAVAHDKPNQPPPGRKRILDSDDEGELPPPGFEPRGGGRKTKKNSTLQSPGRRSKLGEFVTIDVRDLKLTFTVMPGRKMYVPVEGQWLQMIIEHIAQLALQGGVEPGPDFAALLLKSDRPRIGWRAAGSESKFHGNWYMRCTVQQDGTTQRLRAGFQVPRRALSGELYTASEAMHAAKQVLRLVKRSWNERDLSDLARFDT